MSFVSERLIHDNPPSPQQLHALADVGIKSAVAREQLKTMSKRGIHFLIDELELPVDLQDEDDSRTQIRHHVAVRIDARPPEEGNPKTWRLKYNDSFFVTSHLFPGVKLGELTTYSFEWTRGRVLMADRALKLVGFQWEREGTLENDLEYFKIRDDDAALLQVSEDFRMVSGDDCEELTKDMSEYFKTVEAVKRS